MNSCTKRRSAIGANAASMTTTDFRSVSAAASDSSLNIRESYQALIESTEEWRTIRAHPRYDVSSLGRVRSRRGTPRILATWTDPAGYVKVTLDKVGRYVHQLVAEAFIGPRPDGHEVDHKNRVRNDNRALNIQYLTHEQNMAKIEWVPRSHCKHGHPLSGDNLYIRPGGKGECRTCNRASQARWRKSQDAT